MGRRSKYADDELRLIIAAYERIGPARAAAELGMTANAVSMCVLIARRRGIEVGQAPPSRAALADDVILERIAAFGRLGAPGAARELGVKESLIESAIDAARRRGIPVPRPPTRRHAPSSKRVRHTRAKQKIMSRRDRDRQTTEMIRAYNPPRFIDANLAHELLCRAFPRKSSAA